VVRSSTLISLATQVPYRVLPLVRAAASRTAIILSRPESLIREWPSAGQAEADPDR
jgi:hypothetical protein